MSESISLNDVYKELLEIKKNMVSKEEIVSLVTTLEITHNPETMRQLENSEKDILSGRTKKIQSFKDILSEL